MLDVTGWAVLTWLKLTALLALAVGVCWLTLGTDSGWFWIAAAAAVVLDLYIARQLAREWGYEASLRWWWTR
ncbi:hypothetical protein [Pseudonocardia nigra]|uniref:hypothetical protein n=1 Tax=Pseudonocardia nigra TaxID=1921578 RepID=UPI001C5F76FA|nr:hypothetical protein [Pseudonocardia nigra]